MPSCCCSDCASALVASALFNVGLALQALAGARDAEVAEPPRLPSRPPASPAALVARLAPRRSSASGPQALALATAPFVVCSACARGRAAPPAPGIGSRTLGERVGVPAWIRVVSIVAGVALVAAGAPAHTETHRGILAVAAVAGWLLSDPGAACHLAWSGDPPPTRLSWSWSHREPASLRRTSRRS